MRLCTRSRFLEEEAHVIRRGEEGQGLADIRRYVDAEGDESVKVILKRLSAIRARITVKVSP